MTSPDDERQPFLVAPPGTPADSPLWRPAWQGLILRWGTDGTCPHVAVKRGNVLYANGIQPEGWPDLDAEIDW